MGDGQGSGGHPVVEVVVGRGPVLLVAVSARLELGRECDGLLVGDPLVSRRHLALVPSAGSITVEDLGSSNGTLLNGAPISRPTPLAAGDEVLAGDTVIRLAGLVAAPPGAAPPAPGGPGPERATVVRPLVRPADGAGAAVRATSIERLAVEVREEGSPLRTVAELGAQTGGTLTFAFSDIESSTERAAAMGDTRWFAALTAHNRIVEAIVADHGGQVVKAIGDGYMLTFPSARRGVKAATAIQRAITAHAEADPDTGVRVRLGLHTGEAIESAGDLFGLHVNTAARIANRAGGGEITVSSITRAITEVAGDLDFGPEEQVELKGLPGTFGISLLQWVPPTP